MRHLYSAFYQRMQSALKIREKMGFEGLFERRDAGGVPDGQGKTMPKTRGGNRKGTITGQGMGSGNITQDAFGWAKKVRGFLSA